MVALSISVTGLVVGLLARQWSTQSQTFQLDLAESRILVNQNNGHGKVVLVVKNTGLTMTRVGKLSIGTDSNNLIVSFLATNVLLSDNTGGTFAPSNSKVVLQGGEMVIVSAQSASITFPASGTWTAASYFTVGKRYLILAYPATGGYVASQPIVAESWSG